ncbi:hypothetical protein U8607_11335 [Methylobacterium durans]|uniref:Uncharacterized protein n=1 Tax=Methylobacterium durans TaxID=2202825 RepID=A0A2U8WC14_9HYPH|nr:hypothetical protein [Methylobacterium durans]AWN43667.1 hypothetical protein DK389_28095 [Methylobacterium durans]MEA1832674.1 hypothetical protein [Methylobacterium durans]
MTDNKAKSLRSAQQLRDGLIEALDVCGIADGDLVELTVRYRRAENGVEVQEMSLVPLKKQRTSYA